MLFNQDNVWANMQRRGKDLSYLHFDLDNPTHWRPFFTKDFQRQLATCQRTEDGLDALQYYNPNMTVRRVPARFLSLDRFAHARHQLSG
jgi:hypothetical protein